MEKMRKAEKLEFLHGISEKVVHSFIFQSGEELQKLVDGVLTEEEKDILQQQELTAEGRFPCRFPGCNKSLKYNGKTRRNHELSHDPSVQFEDSLLLTQSSPGCTAPPEETKAGDDVYKKENLDDNIKQQLPSGKHSHGSLERDLNELIIRAFEFKIFSEVELQNIQRLPERQTDREKHHLGN